MLRFSSIIFPRLIIISSLSCIIYSIILFICTQVNQEKHVFIDFSTTEEMIASVDNNPWPLAFLENIHITPAVALIYPIILSILTFRWGKQAANDYKLEVSAIVIVLAAIIAWIFVIEYIELCWDVEYGAVLDTVRIPKDFSNSVGNLGEFLTGLVIYIRIASGNLVVLVCPIDTKRITS